jgi:uncharacterized protein (TIGR03437 family)
LTTPIDFVYTFQNNDQYHIQGVIPAVNTGGTSWATAGNQLTATYLGNDAGTPSGLDVLTIDYLQNFQNSGVSADPFTEKVYGGFLGPLAMSGSSASVQSIIGGQKMPLLGPFSPPDVFQSTGSASFSGLGNPLLFDRHFVLSFGAGSAAGASMTLDSGPVNLIPLPFTISTVAGNGTAGYSGDGGLATVAGLNPNGVAVDSRGNLYIVDIGNERIRKVAPNGTITTVAGTGAAGFSGDGGLATEATLNQPSRVAVDTAGNLYIADSLNNRVRKVTPAGTISTFAGNGVEADSGDGGPATSAALNFPSDLVTDTAGNLLITDNSQVVRKVAPNGIITTVAGNGTEGYSGDGGPATTAALNFPRGIAVDAAGNLFISDQSNERIRKVSNGIITTVAGNGSGGYAGDGGVATSARLNNPAGLALDAAGNLYISDRDNNRIRVLLTNGTIWTVAGNGSAAYSGDGGPATSAALYNPRSVAILAGLVYIADNANNRVRLLTRALQTPSISTGGVVSASAFGEFTSVSPGSWIEIYGSNLAVDTRSWAGSDFTGVNAPTSLDGTSVTIGGQAAFIDYISPGQVNALVPSNVATGVQPMTVTVAGATTAAYNLNVNPVQPGLDAPPSFKIGGTQYAVALFADGTYVLPEGAIPGLNSRPAQPGDEIVLYGVGFGPVTPSIPAGQLVQQANTLASTFSMSIGGVPVTNMPYSGLAPSYTGLYQFNIVVPANTGSGAVPLTFIVDGVAGTQTLYLAVGN